eukprot:2289972-Pleurochrysis_carterae.AAC.1
MELALHCRSRLLVAYNFDISSLRNPVFASQGAASLSNQQTSSRQTRSQTHSTSTQAAAPTAAPALPVPSVSPSGLPPHSTDEAIYHIVAPELVDATDRKMIVGDTSTVHRYGRGATS